MPRKIEQKNVCFRSDKFFTSDFFVDPAVALVIMVVTAAFLVPASAAPTYHQPPTDSTASWWYNACGHSGIVHDHRKHHNRSDRQIFNPVKNQMKLMTEKLKKEFGEIKTMYRQVCPPHLKKK